MPCDRKIGPYDCCSVVQGDCLELMKAIPSEIFRCECGEDVSGEGGVFHIAAGHKMQNGRPFSLCLTDPPYGVQRDKGFGGQQSFGGGNGKAIARRTYPDSWDEERPGKPYFDELLRIAEHAIIFGGNYFADILSQSKHWIVWDKLSTMPTFSDCELAWTNIERNSVRKYTVEWNGLLGREQFRDHPTQKPLKLMLEILADYPGDVVIDPYCGSGTTLVAAKKLGRHFLGFEISEEYCKIARDRIARVEAQPMLFEPKAEQMKLSEG